MIFRFAHPWFLATLVLVPLWIWVRVSPRLRPALHYPAPAWLKALPRSPARRLHPLLHVLSGLGMTLLIVALARPQTGLSQRQVKTDTLDIVLALDTSTSMRAIDPGNEPDRDRLDAVKDVAKTFVDKREADRIGLIAFAAMPYTKSPLTLDHDWLKGRIDELRTGELPDGTAVGSALASAVNRLRDSESKSKVIVLLTDGINTTGDIAPLDAAPLAAENDIRVYTIGAGSDGPVRIPVQDMFGRTVYQRQVLPIDTDTLRQIAEQTGGRFFRARDEDELEEVFLEIDALERTEIELNEFTLYTERFPWILAAGLGLLCMERLLAAGRLGRTLA